MSKFCIPGIHDINERVKEYRSVPDAVLLDVRTPQEYREGRIPGSRNIPLLSIRQVEDIVEDKAAPLFVYCYSGERSRKGARVLRKMGYENVENIGGIVAYRGPVES